MTGQDGAGEGRFGPAFAARGPAADVAPPMSEIVTLLVPFFGVIVLGWGAGYFKLIKADHLAGLDFFVFYLALPALFIQLIAATPLASFAGWSFIGTTTFATYCAFAIAFSIGALINGGNVPEATVQGLAGSYSNTAYLAPALAIAAFGSTAGIPMVLIFTFDSALLFTITPLMMALGGTVRTDAAKLAEGIARQIFLNPLVIATALGFAVAGSAIKIPTAADALLSLVAGAAAPGALFVLGVNLALRPMARLPAEVPILVSVKLLIHPLIVYLLLSWVGGFDPIWIHTAVLIAALPPAANMVALAQQYRVYEVRASAALLLGTVISVATVTLVVIALLRDVFPLDPFR